MRQVPVPDIPGGGWGVIPGPRRDIPPRIGILSHPNGGASATPPLKNLIQVLSPCAGGLCVVTAADSSAALEGSPKTQVRPVRGITPHGLPRRLVNYLLVQTRAAYQLARTGREVDLWVFSIDGQNQVLPMLVARILGRPVILLFAYSAVETLRLTNPVLALGASLFSSATCTLCDRIGIAATPLVDAWSLARWRSKIRVAHEHFIDLAGYPPGDRIEMRERVVGFVGRLNPEKGAMEFLEAVSILHARDPGLRFRIIGDGLLRDEMEAYIRRHGLEECVWMPGWVPHADVREHLARLQLLVVPSYTESGPMIAYEAMGVATPLLITKGGLVAGLIEDGVNGYLFDTPAPASIASGVERALGDPALEAVATAGRRLVEQELSFERASRRLEGVICEILGVGRRAVGGRELTRPAESGASNVT